MATSAAELSQEISFFKNAKKLQVYTQQCLENPHLNVKQKIELLHLNQNNRLDILVKIQQHTFAHIFLKKPTEFFTTKYHYDWWIFPMRVPQQWRWEQRNYDASINIKEARELLYNEQFVATYIHSVSMYITALKEQGWNNYPVRYARMLHSLSLFLYVAQKEENLAEVYGHLYQQITKAVIYAQQYVLPGNEDYDLLQMGYNEALLQIERYEEKYPNETQLSMK